MPSFQASSRTKRAGKRSASEVWVPDCARHSEADAEMDDQVDEVHADDEAPASTDEHESAEE